METLSVHGKDGNVAVGGIGVLACRGPSAVSEIQNINIYIYMCGPEGGPPTRRNGRASTLSLEDIVMPRIRATSKSITCISPPILSVSDMSTTRYIPNIVVGLDKEGRTKIGS